MIIDIHTHIVVLHHAVIVRRIVSLSLSLTLSIRGLGDNMVVVRSI